LCACWLLSFDLFYFLRKERFWKNLFLLRSRIFDSLAPHIVVVDHRHVSVCDMSAIILNFRLEFGEICKCFKLFSLNIKFINVPLKTAEPSQINLPKREQIDLLDFLQNWKAPITPLTHKRLIESDMKEISLCYENYEINSTRYTLTHSKIDIWR
jgi:hypothetical protein